jgi:hypothetical protein
MWVTSPDLLRAQQNKKEEQEWNYSLLELGHLFPSAFWHQQSCFLVFRLGLGFNTIAPDPRVIRLALKWHNCLSQALSLQMTNRRLFSLHNHVSQSIPINNRVCIYGCACMCVLFLWRTLTQIKNFYATLVYTKHYFKLFCINSFNLHNNHIM